MIKRFAVFVMLLGIFVLPALVATGAVSANGNSEAAKACQQGGYADLQGTDGTRFTNTGDCVSFAAQGGELIDFPAQSLTLSYLGNGGAYCAVFVEMVSFPANTVIAFVVNVSGNVYYPVATTDALGNWNGTPIGTYYQYGGASVTVTAGGLTTPTLPISC